MAAYDIVDFGIAGIDEWRNRFGDPFAMKSREQILEVILSPGGTPGLLKKNLVDRRLSPMVSSMFFGDFADFSSNRRYEFMFLDAAHNDLEIATNLPLAAKWLSEDYVLICDDIVERPAANAIEKIVNSDVGILTSEMTAYCKLGIFARGRWADVLSTCCVG